MYVSYLANHTVEKHRQELVLSFAFGRIRYDVFGELKLGGPGGQRIPETESVFEKTKSESSYQYK